MYPASRLYTFGYEGQDITAFIAHLRQHGVDTVVDVRELPLSRKKGFSKSSFAAALAEAGIGYVHMPSLGCPKPVRDQYRADRDWAAYSVETPHSFRFKHTRRCGSNPPPSAV